MDFIDLIKALGEKVARMKESIQTEEATKMAFIMAFIAALGYDVSIHTKLFRNLSLTLELRKVKK